MNTNVKPKSQTLNSSASSAVSYNSVLKNTYLLLSATLLFSAFAAALSMRLNIQMNIVILLGGFIGLSFLVERFKNSSLGIVMVFALTGFLGLSLGPVLNRYLYAIPDGQSLIVTALGGTGIIFLGLSGYALISKKDFSFIGGMLFSGMLIAFLAVIASMLFGLPALSLAVSAVFVLLMSGLILFKTSQIIHGGETNYISATVGLYVAIYNLFLSLLHILSAFRER